MDSSTEQSVNHVGKILGAGELVGMPTETVYGLAGDAESDTVVAKIFSCKGRPSFNPLIIHVASINMAKRYVEWNDAADALVKKFWPGPLTLVLPRRADAPLSLLATAGLNSVAIRMPDHPVALALLRAFGRGVAAPSANKSGRISPTTAQHVRDEFGDAIFVLDGGPCRVGLESTVVDLTEGTPVVLRPGAVGEEEVLDAVCLVSGKKEPAESSTSQAPSTKHPAPKSPGMLLKHYSPTIPVRLNVAEVRAGEALLAFGDAIPTEATHALNLSASGDVVEAAANLFAMLRALDRAEHSGIAVMPIPEIGLGIAINDRLRRAAEK